MKSIGKHAFDTCSHLRKISLPDSVTFLGEGAFSRCVFLTSVKLSENISEIGDHMFFSCTALENITIPAGVKTISEKAFYWCESLESIFAFDFSFHQVPFTLRKYFLAGFYSRFRSYSKPVIRSYISYIERDMQKNPERYVAPLLENKELLVFLTEKKVIPEARIEYYLDEAQKKGDTAAVAILMEYLNKVFGAGLEDYFERQEAIAQEEAIESGDWQIMKVDSILFEGKIFVLTGLDDADKARAEALIESKGGVVKSAVVLATDYLIVNEQFDHKTTKYKRAIELNTDKGKDIQIISLEDFWVLAT